MNPLTENSKGIDYQSLTESEKRDVATSVANLLDECPQLFEILQAWPQVDEKLRKVILSIVR